MAAPVGRLHSLNIDPQLIRRAVALTKPHRSGRVAIPAFIGTPGMVLISDTHGEIESCLKLFEALPSVRFTTDLGDKVDRGPDPIGMNFLFDTLGIKRIIGNHDAMWVAAGLGIPSQSIELVRWLMRYNEIDFLTSQLGVNLKPLREFADRRFKDGAHRIDVKSTASPDMEAAATYLKIIAEAPVRFPEMEVTLNDSDLRIRDALFFKAAFSRLTSAEQETFNRLTGPDTLSAHDTDYFYRLIGGFQEFTDEEQAVMAHIVDEFRNNAAFYDFVKWMVGDGDVHRTFRAYQGYPCDVIATHATIPLDEEGNLAPFLGNTGRAMMEDIKFRLRTAMTAWGHMIQLGDTSMMEEHKAIIGSLAHLPWTSGSPIYARQMKTAARAVLQQSSGTWEEPKTHFFTHFEKLNDWEASNKQRGLIGHSFGVNPDNFIIVRGHEPSKDGSFQVLAGGLVVNIDGGLAKAYGGRGGALVFGSKGAAWLSYPGLEFSRVPLPCDGKL